MVLKIMEPTLERTLLDSLEKRLNWLSEVCADLGVKGVRFLHARAEEQALDPTFREQFDLATARAVASMNTLSEICLPYVKPGGRFLAMKSVDSSQEVDAAGSAVAKLGGYEPNTDQVQTLVYACMTGQAVADVLKGTGVKLGTKIATASIEKISGATLTRINQKVGFRLITKFGQTGIINLGKMVPLAGGVIGGGFDLVTTNIIAQNALKLFIETTIERSEQNDSDTIGED